jgi:rhamnulokinase
MRKALSLVETRLEGLGIDSWGVDYALLDGHGELLRNPYHYRDSRNPEAMAEALRLVAPETIYSETGVQLMPINTLYQLVAAQRTEPKIFKAAQKLLMIPDLFNYWLTGIGVCEYTEATTTQLVNPVSRMWSQGLIDRFEFPRHLFPQIVEPGTIVGALLSSVGSGTKHAGTPVIAPASHDTGSAVASVTARGETAFISSGTWSLVGIELDAPLVNSQTMRFNFTNEGGIGGTTRLLKNVMGLWMLQGCRQAWAAQGKNHDYVSLIEKAVTQPAFATLLNPDDPSFLNPRDMPGAIDQFCRKTSQAVPGSPGACTRAILESLALKYRVVIQGIEELTGRRIREIRVIGGGAKNRALNQFTADATGKRVVAGPVEAAVIGNLGVQMIATGAIDSVAEMRAIVDRSFPVESFEARDPGPWERHAQRFEQYCEFTYA